MIGVLCTLPVCAPIHAAMPDGSNNAETAWLTSSPTLLGKSDAPSKTAGKKKAIKPKVAKTPPLPRLQLQLALDFSPEPPLALKASDALGELAAAAGGSAKKSSANSASVPYKAPPENPVTTADAARISSLPAPSQPIPPEDVRPGPAAPPPRPPENQIPDLTEVISAWSIPPIRWGGTTSSIYNWSGSQGSSSFSDTQTVNLRASSYIYEPWYAQVSGSVGLMTSDTQSKNSQNSVDLNGPNSSSKSRSNTTTTTYNANLNLFPLSRYPFQVYVGHDDSRAKASETATQYSQTRFGARQSYRPEFGNDSYSGAYDHSTLASGKNKSTVDALQGTYNDSFDNHTLSATARMSFNGGDAGGQSSTLFGASGVHTWRGEEDITVSTRANYINNQTKLLNLAGLNQTNSQILQVGSTFSWLPDEELPLTVTGGGSFLTSNTDTDVAKNSVVNLNGFLGAGYRFSEQLNGNASVSANQNIDSTAKQFSSIQNASLLYMGTPLKLGDFSYNWGASSAANNNYATSTKNIFSISGSAQHSLNRQFPLSPNDSIALTLSQSTSVNHNSQSKTFQTVSHGAGAAWRTMLGEQTAASLTASVSDSMSFGEFPSHSRSYTTQGNVQSQLSRRSSVAANLNFNYSQQLKATTTTDATGTVTATPVPGSLAGSGSVTYSHRSPFDIANLNYTASLMLNASQTNLRIVAGDPNAMSWQSSFVLQQTVDYRMGKLVFKGTASFVNTNGKENASLFGMVSREFGD